MMVLLTYPVGLWRVFGGVAWGGGLGGAARAGAFGLLLDQVGHLRVRVLQQIAVFHRVWLVGHLLEGLRLDGAPVVCRFILHEETVLFQVIDGGSHLGVADEYLVEEVPGDDIDPLFVEFELAGKYLLLQLHGVLLLSEGQRPAPNQSIK